MDALTMREIALYVAVAAVAVPVTLVAASAVARAARAARRGRSPQNAVAAIGTVVAMFGVGHAMYDRLAPDTPGLHPWPLFEACVAALFLELVVASCAQRARQRAEDAQAARLDVAIVLLAAAVSGLVSGLHAGWNTAGLFRFAVPPIAALVWLGGVITKLRAQRDTDAERALRAVVLAIGRRVERDTDRNIWLWTTCRRRRADLAFVRALSAYAALGADRAVLTARVNEIHHRTDLLSASGQSPWLLPDPGDVTAWLPWPQPPAVSTVPVAVRDAVRAALDPTPDPLLPAVKALIAADPGMGRPRLQEALRDQGHGVGTDRAAALLRAAKAGARTPANGHGS